MSRHNAGNNNQVFPDRKISETLLAFAKPVLDMMDKEALESGLRIAVTVWNSVILDKQASGNQCMIELRIRAATGPDGFDALVDKLVERKNKYFSDDMRLIANEKVRWEKGQWIVSAEARVNRKTGA
jgi:hypothetical protein